MSARKRSRPVVEENRAECPFSVSYETSGRAEQDRQKSAKKRKRDGQDEEKKVTIQISPFEPAGQFKTHDTMDLHYAVEPRKRWLDMTRYNSFVLNGTKYYSEGFVYVANESTIERQRAANQGNAPPKKKEDDWVARILEIRAADEHHVYARIYWMYWPDELPVCTMNGKKTLSGRQPYHGQNELVASNHMDVINVVSVTMPATVNQWIETDDEEIQDSLYWRQAYNWRTGQLSSVELICKCQTPANPDKTLIGCTNPDCGKWLHHECLSHDVLMRVYDRLGTDKPHIKEELGAKDAVDQRTTRPLSPTDTGDKETQPTIDVRSGDVQDNVLVRRTEEDIPRQVQTPTPVPQSQTSDSATKSSTAKKGRKKKAPESKPYEGLFQATLKMTDGPTMWEIEDLREDVTGGMKKWREQANCLLCNTTID